MVLTQSGLKDVVTIPAGTDWTAELMGLINVLKIDALKNSEDSYYPIAELVQIDTIVNVI